MAHRSSVDYFNGIRAFISELSDSGKNEASRKMKECFDYINNNSDGWKMFYRKLLLVKEEYSFKFTKDENIKLDGIIEAAKRVMSNL
jgi:hypothetical protein